MNQGQGPKREPSKFSIGFDQREGATPTPGKKDTPNQQVGLGSVKAINLFLFFHLPGHDQEPKRAMLSD